MSKKNPQPSTPVPSAALTSGAGNLSDADKAALMAQQSSPQVPQPEPEPEDAEPLTAEAVAEAMQAAGFNNPLDLIKAIVTLGDRVETLETAVEHHAGLLVVRPKPRPDLPHVPPVAAAATPATPEEEAAYCRANLDGGGFNGIQDWRNKTGGLNAA
jgi:hypothetical protein